MSKNTMSEAQLLDWGEVEDATRKRELATVDNAEHLARVQKDAKRRRLAVGLSAGAAATWVHRAQSAAKERARRHGTVPA